MIVKVEIRGERAVITGEPGSGFASFEESAARFRPRFKEAATGADPLIGYFGAELRVLGESKDAAVHPLLADVFEIKDRVHPKERW